MLNAVVFLIAFGIAFAIGWRRVWWEFALVLAGLGGLRLLARRDRLQRHERRLDARLRARHTVIGAAGPLGWACRQRWRAYRAHPRTPKVCRRVQTCRPPRRRTLPPRSSSVDLHPPSTAPTVPLSPRSPRDAILVRSATKVDAEAIATRLRSSRAPAWARRRRHQGGDRGGRHGRQRLTSNIISPRSSPWPRPEPRPAHSRRARRCPSARGSAAHSPAPELFEDRPTSARPHRR